MKRMTRKQEKAMFAKLRNKSIENDNLIVNTNIGYERIYNDGFFHIGNRKIKPIKKNGKYFVIL